MPAQLQNQSEHLINIYSLNTAQKKQCSPQCPTYSINTQMRFQHHAAPGTLVGSHMQ